MFLLYFAKKREQNKIYGAIILSRFIFKLIYHLLLLLVAIAREYKSRVIDLMIRIFNYEISHSLYKGIQINFQLLTNNMCFNSSLLSKFTCAVSLNHRLNQCPNHTSPHSHCNGFPAIFMPPKTLRVPTASQLLAFG